MTEKTEEIASIYSDAIDQTTNKYIRDAKIAAIVYYTALCGRRMERSFPIDFVFDSIDWSRLTRSGKESLMEVKKGLNSSFKNPKKDLLSIFITAFKIYLRYDPISKRDTTAEEEANEEIQLIKEYSKGNGSPLPRLFKDSEIFVEFIKSSTLSCYQALQLNEKVRKEIERTNTDLKLLAKQIITTYQRLHSGIMNIKVQHKKFMEEHPQVWSQISDLEKMGISNLNRVVSFRDIDFVMEAIQEARTETHS